jgi:hypothetical protein
MCGAGGPKASNARHGVGHVSRDEWRRAGLNERESEQTRAQQHQAGHCQREESVGHKVMITHTAPTARDADPNLLKISESAFLQKVLRAPAEIRPSNESLQTRGQGKCRHSSSLKLL